MKLFLIHSLIFLLTSGCLNAQSDFDRHFEEGAMRIDLVLAGNNKTQAIYLQKVSQEPHWGDRKQTFLTRSIWANTNSLLRIKKNRIPYTPEVSQPCLKNGKPPLRLNPHKKRFTKR